jgi:hypothetical protein
MQVRLDDDKDTWWILVNAATKLRVPQIAHKKNIKVVCMFYLPLTMHINTTEKL